MATLLARRIAAWCCLVFLLPSCGGSEGQRTDRSPDHGRPSARESPNSSLPRGLVPAHAMVVRLDAASGEIEAVVPVGPDPLLLAVASGRVWTLNFGDGSLSQIDPRSNKASRIGSGVVVGFTSDGRDLWVARDGNVVSRLDGATGQEKSSFTLGPRPLFALRDAGFLGVGQGSLWLTVPQVGEPRAPHSLAPRPQDRGGAGEVPARP
jgi:streptogramin lyase